MSEIWRQAAVACFKFLSSHWAGARAEDRENTRRNVDVAETVCRHAVAVVSNNSPECMSRTLSSFNTWGRH
jgi:hypothetical protein